MGYRELTLISLAALLCCQSFLFAGEKSDRLKPKWVTHELPEPQTESYMFIRSHGEGSSLAAAKQMAFVSMSQHLETERGLSISTDIRMREHLYQGQRENENSYEQDIILEITENNHQLKIICREIDEYWERSHRGYEVDVLYTVTSHNDRKGSYKDDISVTTKYPNAGFLSLIPSVGQFYKGDSLKGSLILAGELACAGGILICENTRSSYVKKMSEQPKHAAEYNSLADEWETDRNICIGAAIAVYAYNLIDAFAATGAKYVVIKKSRVSVSAIPYADAQSAGMGLAFKF